MVFCSIIAAQHRKRPFIYPLFHKSILFIETNIFPTDTIPQINFSYKISYERLVFKKAGEVFKSGIELTFGIYKNKKLVFTSFVNKNIELKKYKETLSPNSFLQGLTKISLEPGQYIVKPQLNLLNAQNTLTLGTFPLKVLPSNKYRIIKPLVVYSANNRCKDQLNLVLANNKSDIPFSPKKYSLLIPVTNTSVNFIDISIFQNNKIVIKERLNSPVLLKLNLIECSGKISVNNNGNKKTNNFLLENVNSKLLEGSVKIDISTDKVKRSFHYQVVWLNKPFVLNNPRMAIKLIKYFKGEKIVDSLLSFNSNDYYKKLVNYWKKFDPIKKTTFNELMNEFYTRADYAIRHFSSLNGLNGALSSRGQIYIKLGPPDRISRNYSEKNQVIEIWEYSKLKEKFYFIDRTGLGNFKFLK